MKTRLYAWMAVLVAAPLVGAEPSGAASDSTVCGTIQGFEGKVGVTREATGKREPAAKGMELQAGDDVRTGVDSSATILLHEGTTLRLASQTSVQIEDPADEEGDTSAVSLFLGRIWAGAKKAFGDKYSFQVYTNAAVAGVRGTEFTAAAGADGSLRVAVDRGAVVVENESGRQQLGAGLETTVDAERAPLKPSAFKAGAVKWDGWLEEKTRIAVQKRGEIAARMLVRFEADRKKLDLATKAIDGLDKKNEELSKKARYLRNINNHAALAKVTGEIQSNYDRISAAWSRAKTLGVRIGLTGHLLHGLTRLEAKMPGKEAPAVAPEKAADQDKRLKELKKMKREARQIQANLRNRLKRDLRYLRELRREFKLAPPSAAGRTDAEPNRDQPPTPKKPPARRP